MSVFFEGKTCVCLNRRVGVAVLEPCLISVGSSLSFSLTRLASRTKGCMRRPVCFLSRRPLSLSSASTSVVGSTFNLSLAFAESRLIILRDGFVRFVSFVRRPSSQGEPLLPTDRTSLSSFAGDRVDNHTSRYYWYKAKAFLMTMPNHACIRSNHILQPQRTLC